MGTLNGEIGILVQAQVVGGEQNYFRHEIFPGALADGC
jgi:hypothetical protein